MANIPHKYDVEIDQKGYMLADSENQKATLSLTPTFIPRTNVQGESPYGDSQQEFWLTFTQKDWSLGEQQKFSRPNDDESARRYWKGAAVNVTRTGQVTQRKDVASLTFAANYASSSSAPAPTSVFVATSTNLYEISESGTITDRGAHGLGAAPSTYGMAHDGTDLYIASSLGGSVGVRKWTGAAFSTFSATDANALAFLNNTLYGVDGITATLIRYDSAGVATTLFTWKQVDGGIASIGDLPISSFGGKLLILHPRQLWLFDGTAPAVIAEFTSSFTAQDMAVSGGVVFITGHIYRLDSVRPTILFYANGTLGVLWQANDYTSSAIAAPSIVSFDEGIVFTDATTNTFFYYNANTGGFSALGAFTPAASAENRMVAGASFLVHPAGGTSGYRYPASAVPASSTITTSLIDFDSSLNKLWRSIMVEWDDDPADTGATVDIAYRLTNLDGSYTTLQTGATSGTHYFLTPVTAKSLSVRVTLNKSGSTSGPTLRRIVVRAVPVQEGFNRRTYVLNCSGKDGKNMVKFRDDSYSTRDGKTLAEELLTAAQFTGILSMKDSLGGFFDGVIENLELLQIRSEEYLARVTVREV